MLQIFRSPRVTSNLIRHARCALTTSSATNAASIPETKAPIRYVPEGASGNYLIEQVSEEWRSCIAGTNFPADSVVGVAHGTVQPAATRFTIQITDDKHLDFRGGLEFVNHSCEPNTRVVIAEHSNEVAFVTTRDVQQGEHLSFDYDTSEWDMDEKFDCKCGSPSCRGHIGGAKYLSKDQVTRALPLFTPSILRDLLHQKLN